MTDIPEPFHPAPGPDTPEGALWRRMLMAAANVAPDFAYINGRWLMRPVKRDADRESSGIDYSLTAKQRHALSERAFDSLSHEDPAVRRQSAEALSEPAEVTNTAELAEMLLDETAIYAFLCSMSPSDEVRAAAHRYFVAIDRLRAEIAGSTQRGSDG